MAKLSIYENGQLYKSFELDKKPREKEKNIEISKLTDQFRNLYDINKSPFLI